MGSVDLSLRPAWKERQQFNQHMREIKENMRKWEECVERFNAQHKKYMFKTPFGVFTYERN